MYVLSVFIVNGFESATESNGAGLPENPSVPRPMLLELPFVLRRVNVLLEGWLDRCARDEVRNRDCMHGCDATKRGAGGNRGG